MTEKPRTIVELRWEETSGVDHPANLEEGWVVMKSADAAATPAPAKEAGMSDLDTIIKEESDRLEASAGLLKTLTDSRDGIFKDAPEHVAAALDSLVKHLESDDMAAAPDNKTVKGLAGFVARVIASLNKKSDTVTDPEVSTPDAAKAAFLKTVTEIKASDATPDEKRAQVDKAFAALEAALS
jgi:hypothetical protein